jgi:hypothetical protein
MNIQLVSFVFISTSRPASLPASNRTAVFYVWKFSSTNKQTSPELIYISTVYVLEVQKEDGDRDDS